MMSAMNVRRAVALLVALYATRVASLTCSRTSRPFAVSQKLVTRAVVASSLATAGLLLVSSSSPAYASSVENGANLFQANCAGCHGGGNNYLAEKKTLRKDALEKFQSLDADKLQTFVQTKMPHTFLPFKKEFSDENYADAIAYVLDQAINDKW